MTVPKLLTLNRDTDDPYSRRAVNLAKEIRTLAQAAIVEKIYGPNGATGGQ